MHKIRMGLRVAAALSALLLLLAACGEPDAVEGPATEAPPSQSEAEETPPSQREAEETPNTSESVTPEPIPPEESPPEHDPEASAETPTPEQTSPPQFSGVVGAGEPVDEDWFADAVFVGDSRTDGLMLYSGIKNTTFISHQGLSVFNIGSQECIDLNGTKVTALTALGQKQWAKVYLMLGINELGYDSEAYRTAYTALVQRIKELQPNAVLYLQTVLPVNEPLAQSKGFSSSITNTRVRLFNDVICDIAESEGAALVDVAEVFWTESGGIAAENTSDGVHLTRQGYVTWYDYLKSHTGTTSPAEDPEYIAPEETGEQEPAQPGEDLSGQEGEGE